MCLYLRAEFEVSSIILTSFSQGVYSEILMHIQPHSQECKLEKRGEASSVFLKIEKSVLIFERKALIVSTFGLNFPFKM